MSTPLWISPGRAEHVPGLNSAPKRVFRPILAHLTLIHRAIYTLSRMVKWLKMAKISPTSSNFEFSMSTPLWISPGRAEHVPGVNSASKRDFWPILAFLRVKQGVPSTLSRRVKMAQNGQNRPKSPNFDFSMSTPL